MRTPSWTLSVPKTSASCRIRTLPMPCSGCPASTSAPARAARVVSRRTTGSAYAGRIPSLTQTTVNGHSIATGDWYIGDQTNTVGRSVSFTLLPSEIVGSVEVQKSSQADYIEGGTVGNVNIVTRKPLDLKNSR